MPVTSRRRSRRRRLGILRTLERLSDDQVLLCGCSEHTPSCGG